MTTRRQRPSGEAWGRVVRFGLCRAVAAAPAVLGSLTVLMLASGALGRWAGALLAAWAACAAGLLTRGGERMAVRAGCRFHRPSPAQAAALKPAWASALRVSGTAVEDVDLYVQTAPVPDAYAAGARVAVTSRLVQDYESGRPPEIQLVAVLVHELGHHATGATRPMLVVAFLAAPWRWTMSLLTGLASMLVGRQPRRGLGIVVVPGLAVAVVRALHQGRWMAGGVPVFVGLAVLLCPLADAAISRRVEYAADRFAADHGLASGLAAALRVLNDGHRARRGWARRLSSHPTFEQPIGALQTATVDLGPDAEGDPHADVRSAEQGPAGPGSRAEFRGVS
jgi:STE24 endopeptidase